MGGFYYMYKKDNLNIIPMGHGLLEYNGLTNYCDNLLLQNETTLLFANILYRLLSVQYRIEHVHCIDKKIINMG